MGIVAESSHQNQLLIAAIDYAQRGWRVLPIHASVDGKCSCGADGCGSIGKHPVTRHGLRDATVDPEIIRRWWTESPIANVGIATGPDSGLFMVGPDGQQGRDDLAELERQHGKLPVTAWCQSGSADPGAHLYYRWPSAGSIINRRNHAGTRIDVRGAGGYVVAPPSLHASGNRYAWISPPETMPLADAPHWLIEWCRNGSAVPASNGKLLLTVGADTRPDVRQRVIAYLAQCQPAVSGQGGHAKTFEIARHVVYGFDLGVDVGFELLKTHYNPTCRPPWSDAELLHKCREADEKPFDKPRGYLLQDGHAAGGCVANLEPVSTSEPDIETIPMPEPPPWPSLPDDALHGLAGEIVHLLEPETESDPIAILGQLLVAFGSAVGRGPTFFVEGDAHHCNLFICLVGESSRGRKGVSRGRVMQIMGYADAAWCDKCVAAGMSSGEGLVWCVRDAITKHEPIKHKGHITGYQDVEIDPGVADKRLLVAESEFAQVLRVMQREGNSLSPTIRQSWDTGNLRTLVKNSPARATGAHISIIGHITRQELSRYLRDTEMFNGFANRFLWLCVRRSKQLPDGGRGIDLSPVGTRLAFALASARNVGTMQRTPAAGRLWRDAYESLTAERSGLHGAVTARSEAQVLRLSMIYALLDGQVVIDSPHLCAAMAVWSYCDKSAKIVFGAEPDNPLLGMVLQKLRDAPDGLTRTEIHATFNRHVPAARLVEALGTLRERGAATAERETGKRGAPAERWRAVRTKELNPPANGNPVYGGLLEGTGRFNSFFRNPVPGKIDPGDAFNSFFRNPPPAKIDADGEQEVLEL